MVAAAGTTSTHFCHGEGVTPPLSDRRSKLAAKDIAYSSLSLDAALLLHTRTLEHFGDNVTLSSFVEVQQSRFLTCSLPTSH